MALDLQTILGAVKTVADDVSDLDRWWDGVSGTPSPVYGPQLPEGGLPVPSVATPKTVSAPAPTPSTLSKSGSNTALLAVAVVVGLILFLR